MPIIPGFFKPKVEQSTPSEVTPSEITPTNVTPIVSVESEPINNKEVKEASKNRTRQKRLTKKVKDRPLSKCKMQIKIMKVLYEARGPITGHTIVEVVGCAPTLGPIGMQDNRTINPKTGLTPRERCDRDMGYPTLLTRGYVDVFELDIDGKTETNYFLTDAGIKAYEDLPEILKNPPSDSETP